MKDHLHSNGRIWTLAAVVFAGLLAWVLFPGVLSPHGFVIPAVGGDAGKNLFAYSYHILHDKGWWYTGSNYPYGDHIVYTDGQPLLSMTLGRVGVKDMATSLSIMWKVIALTYVLAVVYLYKILVRLRVQPVYALVFAGLITIMSPQLLRNTGHFGLSYACAVPMVLYWILKHYETPLRRYGVYIFLLGVAVAFVHPYLAALIAVLTGFYFMGYMVFGKGSVKARVVSQLPLLIGAVSAVVVFNVVIALTDPIKDRGKTPYGIGVYGTTGDHILTSHYSPIWRYVEDHTGAVRNTAGEEGFAYAGLAILAIAVVALGYWVSRLKEKNGIAPADQARLKKIALFTAIAALLLGMGVPFVWGMQDLAESLPIVRQFRTNGRFSWIFYYILCIYGAAALYSWSRSQRERGNSVKAFIVLWLAIGLWAFEASGYVTHQREGMERGKDNYKLIVGETGHNWTNFLKGHGYQADDFQAVLLLRYFHLGMDKLWLGRNAIDVQVGAGFETAMQLQLPMVDAMLSRSSWGITMKQARTVGGPYVTKPMLNDLPNNKPFLLLNLDWDELDPDQAYLLEASDSIGKLGEWKAYACFPDRIRANDKKRTDSIRAIVQTLPVGDSCVGNAGKWYVYHFDEGRATERFYGEGSHEQIKQEDTVLATLAVDPQVDNQLYECSCWFLLGDNNSRSPFFKLELLDASGNLVRSTDMLTGESTDQHGLWFRSFLYFTVAKNCTSIRVRLFNEPDNTYKVMDEFMLRPADALIISKSADGKLMVNNHLL